MGRGQHLHITTTLLSTLKQKKGGVLLLLTALSLQVSSGTGKGHPAGPLLTVVDLDDAEPKQDDHVENRLNIHPPSGWFISPLCNNLPHSLQLDQMIPGAD